MSRQTSETCRQARNHALAPQPVVFGREHTTLLLLHEAVQFVDNDLECPAAHPAFGEWEKLAAEKEASRAAEEAQEVAKVYDKLDGMITKFVCGAAAFPPCTLRSGSFADDALLLCTGRSSASCEAGRRRTSSSGAAA